MTPPKSIALYGGSFDPPHNGHVISITHLLNSPKIEVVWVIPSGDKRYDKEATEKGEDRLALLHLLHEKVFHSESRLKLIDAQLRPEFEDSYAITLVDEIRKRGEKRPLSYVVGADNIEGLPDWKEFERLKEEVTFLVVPRLGETYPVEFPEYVELLSTEPLASFSLASSDLREKLAKNQEVAGYLPEVVLEEIRARKLYQSK